jgi:hypothetical protein
MSVRPSVSLEIAVEAGDWGDAGAGSKRWPKPLLLRLCAI